MYGLFMNKIIFIIKKITKNKNYEVLNNIL